jgi:hypothetical protein
MSSSPSERKIRSQQKATPQSCPPRRRRCGTPPRSRSARSPQGRRCCIRVRARTLLRTTARHAQPSAVPLQQPCAPVPRYRGSIQPVLRSCLPPGPAPREHPRPASTPPKYPPARRSAARSRYRVRRGTDWYAKRQGDHGGTQEYHKVRLCRSTSQYPLHTTGVRSRVRTRARRTNSTASAAVQPSAAQGRAAPWSIPPTQRAHTCRGVGGVRGGGPGRAGDGGRADGRSEGRGNRIARTRRVGIVRPPRRRERRRRARGRVGVASVGRRGRGSWHWRRRRCTSAQQPR